MSNHKNIDKKLQNIKHVYLTMSDLADAFYLTGNQSMAAKMERLASMLESSEKSIQDALSAILRDEVERSKQATSNMIKACLAVSSNKE